MPLSQSTIISISLGYQIYQLIVYITINRCLILVHIRSTRLNEQPSYNLVYSLEVRISSDEGLEDVRIKEEGFWCDFEAKVLKESSSLFYLSLLCISLYWMGFTAVLFEGIGGMYIPINLSTSLFRSRRNYLYRLRMLKSPCGSLPVTRYVTNGWTFSFGPCCKIGSMIETTA